MKAKTFLTPAKRRELARMFATGEYTRASLAEHFDVSASQVSRIIDEAAQAAAQAQQAPLAGLLELGELSATLKARATALGFVATVAIEPKA